MATRNFPLANSSRVPGPPGLSLGIAALNPNRAGLGSVASTAKCGVKKNVACRIRIANRKRDINRCAWRLFLNMTGLSLTTPFYLNKLGTNVEIYMFAFNKK